MLRRSGSTALARKGVAAGGLLLATGLVVLALFATNAVGAAFLIGSGAFFAAFAAPCSYATSIDLGGRYVGTVFATMNMSGNFGSALLIAVAPWFRALVERTPGLLQLTGGNSWNSQVFLYAMMYALSAFCWLMLNMRRTITGRSIDVESMND